MWLVVPESSLKPRIWRYTGCVYDELNREVESLELPGFKCSTEGTVLVVSFLKKTCHSLLSPAVDLENGSLDLCPPGEKFPMVLRPKDPTKPAKVQIPARIQLIIAITLVKGWSLRPPHGLNYLARWFSNFTVQKELTKGMYWKCRYSALPRRVSDSESPIWTWKFALWKTTAAGLAEVGQRAVTVRNTGADVQA